MTIEEYIKRCQQILIFSQEFSLSLEVTELDIKILECIYINVVQFKT